jgi:broad specificity phosphatase PhoE
MESEVKKITLESKEGGPKQQEIVVDLIRHGATEYTGEYPDITEKGKEEIENTAKRIAATIDPQKEIVVFWSSPLTRAMGSAEIIKEVFTRCGIEIVKQSSVSSLRQMEIKDLNFILGLFDKARKEKKVPGKVFLEDKTWAGITSDKVETRSEMQKRIDRAMNYLRYLVEHVDTKGKRLRIISVTHLEIIQPIIQEIFSEDTGNLLKTSEDFEIVMKHNKDSDETEIEFSFRGIKKRGYKFDKETRKFILMNFKS